MVYYRLLSSYLVISFNLTVLKSYLCFYVSNNQKRIRSAKAEKRASETMLKRDLALDDSLEKSVVLNSTVSDWEEVVVWRILASVVILLRQVMETCWYLFFSRGSVALSLAPPLYSLLVPSSGLYAFERGPFCPDWGTLPSSLAGLAALCWSSFLP